MTLQSSELNIALSASARQRPLFTNRRSWSVAVTINGEIDQGILVLQDPFGPEQKTDCTWYLEEFVHKSPYSIERARSTEKALQSYTKSLLEQLKLIDTAKTFRETADQFLKITISIQEDEKADNTVHQLLWELLEDTKAWGIDQFQVTVNRIVASVNASNESPIREEFLGSGNSSSIPSAVNVLLVAARDISKGSTKYDDVSSHLALEALMETKRELRDFKHEVGLHVEVVRPATLEALEKHLERAQVIHGGNFFDLVHFDVHGVAREGQKSAYLLFNSPDIDVDETKKEDATKVAALLQRFHIPAVVLNACESANAKVAENLNIAKVFTSSGVQHVLGMSYRTSSTAARIFLRSLYQNLLVNGQTFSSSAQLARADLRRDSTRDARFGLRRMLTDSFVPVLYSTGQDHVLRIPTSHVSVSGKTDLMPVTLEDVGTKLTGREFDLLRLEKLLLARRVVHLSGRAGVGKTALLKYASILWEDTSFAKILYVDFSTFHLLGVEQLLLTLIRQFFPSDPQRRQQLEAQVRELTSNDYDHRKLSRLFLSAAEKSRLIVIFDGLHVIHTPFPHTFQSTPDPSAVIGVNAFMADLVRAASEEEFHDNIYVIFTTRWNTSLEKWKSYFPYEYPESQMILGNLCLPDSIDLGQKILRSAGVNVDKWTEPDLAELELLVQMLDGIPSTMLTIIPKAALADVPWRQFRSLVHSGKLTQLLVGEEQALCTEIRHVLEDLDNQGCARLLVLSTFWLEMPADDHIHKIMESLNYSSDEEADLAGVIAFTHGFLELDQGSYLHPSFTICGRSFAEQILSDDSCTRPGRPFSSLLSSMKSSASKSESQLEDQKKVAAAMNLFITGASDFADLPISLQSLAGTFARQHVHAIGGQVMARLMETTVIQGITISDLSKFWTMELGNLMTCLGTCLREPHLKIEEWPLFYLQHEIAAIRMVGSTAQITHLAKEFRILLDHSIRLNGGLAFPPSSQYFALHVSNCLAAIYQCEIRVPALFEKYVRLSLDICAASEKQYGPFQDKNVRYLKGMALRYHAFSLLKTGLFGAAERVWNAMLDNDTSTTEGRDASDASTSEDQVASLLTLVSSNGENQEAAAKRLTAMFTGFPSDAYHKSRQGLGKLISLARAAAEQGPEVLNSRQARSVLAKTGYGLKQIHDAFQERGIQNLQEDRRWWPEGFDLRQVLHKFEDPQERLAALENARDTGNMAEASIHQKALLLDALKTGNMSEAQEHANALEGMASGLALDDENNDSSVSQLQTTAVLLQTIISFAGEGLPVTKSAFTETIDQQINHAAAMNMPSDTIQRFELCREILQNSGPTEGNATLFSEDERAQLAPVMQKLLMTVSVNANNPDFLRRLSAVTLANMEIWAKVSKAQANKDWEAVLEYLQELKDILQLPNNVEFAEYLDMPYVEGARTNAQWNIAWEPVCTEFSTALARSEYTVARDALLGFQVNHLRPDLVSKYRTSLLPKFLGFTESWPLDKVKTSSVEAFKKGKVEEAVQACDNLLVTLETSSFQYLDDDEIRHYKFRVEYQKLGFRFLQAIQKDSWESGAQIGEEIRQFNASNPTLAQQNFEGLAIDMKEICESGFLLEKWKAAVNQRDVEECQRCLDGFRALQQRQKETPDVVRRWAVMITDEDLKHYENWIRIIRGWNSVAQPVTQWLGRLWN